MCRSIKTLREPFQEQVTDEDVRAAALQYVRKISGFRAPAAHNADAFNQAVDAVAAATQALLDGIVVKGGHTHSHSHSDSHSNGHSHDHAHEHDRAHAHAHAAAGHAHR